MSKKIVNQFLFDRGQDNTDTSFQGIAKSSNLVVDKYDKAHTTVLKQMPEIVAHISVDDLFLWHLFERDSTKYAVAQDGEYSCIIEFTVSKYRKLATNSNVNMSTVRPQEIRSCQVGKYQYVLYPAKTGSLLYAYDFDNDAWIEIGVPGNNTTKQMAYATSICYWIGHVFLNDLNCDHVYYSRTNPQALTGDDFYKQFSDASGTTQYRSLGYLEGVNMWTGIIGNKLWSVSSSYIQQWTVSDSSLVPIYANADNIVVMDTRSVNETRNGIALFSIDHSGNPHLYLHNGKLEAIENDEVARRLRVRQVKNRTFDVSEVMSFGWFRDHEFIVFKDTPYPDIYAYDTATKLWTCPPLQYYYLMAQTLGDSVILESERKKLYKFTNGTAQWTRAGAIWLEDHSDFYCDRLALKFDATSDCTVTVKWRMRRENEELGDGDWVMETWTIQAGSVDLQVPNCGYGDILELEITTTARLYDCRAYISGGGRF